MQSDDQIWAILPLKSRHLAKQRLGHSLSKFERQALSEKMFEDVLIAINGARFLKGLVVVTCDDYTISRAQLFGGRVIRTDGDIGLSASVEMAAQALFDDGVANIITLPGDVPLVTSQEIDQVCQNLLTHRGITIVPDQACTGTNSIACSRRSVIPFSFGLNSFEKHRQLAQKSAHKSGLTVNIEKLDGLGLDIDTEEDIAALMKRRCSSHTQHYVSTSGIADKIQETCNADIAYEPNYFTDETRLAGGV